MSAEETSGLSDLHKPAAERVKRLRNSGRLHDSATVGEAYLAKHRNDKKAPPIRVMCSLATSYIRLHEFDSAKKLLLDALALEPGNEVIHNLLGQCAIARGDKIEARKWFEKSLAIDERNDVALHGLKQCTSAGWKSDEARKWFEKVLTINPRDEVAHQVLGICTFAEGRTDEARRWFKKTLAINPRNEVAHQGLGQCALAEGKTDEAQQWFKETLAINPSNEVALISIGGLGVRQSQPVMILQAIDGLSKLPASFQRFSIMRDYARLGVGQSNYLMLLQVARTHRLLPDSVLDNLAFPDDIPVSPDNRLLPAMVASAGHAIEVRHERYARSVIATSIVTYQPIDRIAHGVAPQKTPSAGK